MPGENKANDRHEEPIQRKLSPRDPARLLFAEEVRRMLDRLSELPKDAPPNREVWITVVNTQGAPSGEDDQRSNEKTLIVSTLETLGPPAVTGSPIDGELTPRVVATCRLQMRKKAER